MKLLLTSAGITNKSIEKALFEMVGKKPEDTSIVFIPTAANIEKGDMGWLIDNLIQLKNINFKQIEITDISAVPENIWRPKLEEADVIFFEGGNTFYLMEWINHSGVINLLPELLKTRVYVGVSAGSMVTNPSLILNHSQIIYGGNFDKTGDMKALGYVDFHLLPHLNSEYFTKLRKENIEKLTKDMNTKLYALDDDSALKVVDGKVEVVSEGDYLVFNDEY